MKVVSIKLVPVKTEKTYKLARTESIYTFKGSVNLTKADVINYIKKAYGFEVTWIRAVKIPGKTKTDYTSKARRVYKTKPYKKFYIRIKDGTFEVFK